MRIFFFLSKINIWCFRSPSLCLHAEMLLDNHSTPHTSLSCFLNPKLIHPLTLSEGRTKTQTGWEKEIKELLLCFCFLLLASLFFSPFPFFLLFFPSLVHTGSSGVVSSSVTSTYWLTPLKWLPLPNLPSVSCEVWIHFLLKASGV